LTDCVGLMVNVVSMTRRRRIINDGANCGKNSKTWRFSAKTTSRNYCNCRRVYKTFARSAVSPPSNAASVRCRRVCRFIGIVNGLRLPSTSPPAQDHANRCSVTKLARKKLWKKKHSSTTFHYYHTGEMPFCRPRPGHRDGDESKFTGHANSGNKANPLMRF
jgi:hypothetical protein